jgi:hypothetical protein
MEPLSGPMPNLMQYPLGKHLDAAEIERCRRLSRARRQDAVDSRFYATYDGSYPISGYRAEREFDARMRQAANDGSLDRWKWRGPGPWPRRTPFR